jgi:hypothetical protein
MSRTLDSASKDIDNVSVRKCHRDSTRKASAIAMQARCDGYFNASRIQF